MKKAYSYDDIKKMIIGLDVRAQKLTDDQINMIMDTGYAELATVVQTFADEEVIPCDQFYDIGEPVQTIDIQEDVVELYGLYLTIENLSFEEFPHGIQKFESVDYPNAVYQDNRYNGRVHIDLTQMPEGKSADNLVIKYFYTPQHTTETVYMDQQTALATRYAMSAALYLELHDVERESQKRAAMQRTGRAITETHPRDLYEPTPAIFKDGGSYVV